MISTGSLVIGFQDIDRSMPELVGGKGANLGELSRIEGVQVPDGFCISTEAFKKMMGEEPAMNGLLDQLSLLKVEDKTQIRELSGEIRRVIEGIQIPKGIEAEIMYFLSSTGDKNAYAIRSSATAEDLPTASFAGQQDTYLNITGTKSILQHISKCWASLFTERAIIYRIQNSFDHRKVSLSVVVQKMVFPQVAGILFTADPINGNRKVVSIDASFGLGEALVSGIVNADNYKVRNGKINEKKISTKKLEIIAAKDGGTKEKEVKPEMQSRQVLTDKQILQLESLGRKIEAHFGNPQDIEWCLSDGTFYILQSRPITTLFPVPEANDTENHVYVSVAHNQMMTDAMKPLGISFFLMIPGSPMRTAGGRLFVDITRQLASPGSRKKLIETFGQSEALITDAVISIAGRKDFIKPLPDNDVKTAGYIEKLLPWTYLSKFENNTSIVHDLISSNQASVDALKQNIRSKTGTDLFDFILEDIPQLKQSLFNPQSWEVIKIALYAATWINKKMLKWLGEKKVADTLSQSVSNNITSEMGLALLDVADAIRPYPELIEYLQQVKDDPFLEEMIQFEGGKQAQEAIKNYLSKYGMRCVGEIDITKTRWSEKPSILLPMILSNIKNFEPGAGARKFEQGLQEAMNKEQELLERLKQLPDGKRKARETKRMIGLLRNFIGYREYPKYGKVNRIFVYKQALMKEAEQLVQAGVIHKKEDVFYLNFEEFRNLVQTQKADHELISKRKAEFSINEKLTPPRVITSDGEVISGKYKYEHLPAGAIAGLAVSSGVIEGRARVILNMEEADLEEGDILVTAFTDPSWTPLFVSIKGLVTEVGGLMTHGAVIAREYGLPAVVGVENATKLIKDKQRIRVNGTDGHVEILI